jgi:glycosyltransferase involved in cell wall biosynthesis
MPLRKCAGGRSPVASGRPIRITYLITDLEVGGVPLHLFRLATRLPRDRFDARVISLANVGPVGRMIQEAGLPVVGCNARSATDLRALWRLRRLLAGNHPDVLHALLFHANLAARLVGPMAGVDPRRIICEIQTVEIERRWHLWLDNLTCRLCRCEIGNSPSVVDHLRRKAHIPSSRLRCEPGAVDVDAIAAAIPISRSESGWPAEGPIILWVGRFDPVKGFEEMLGAFRMVASQINASLVLVGDGPYRYVVDRVVRDCGLTGRVILMGHRSDVPRLLRSADLFLMSSRTEGLPNAILEAMAAGLGIVATDVPGCRDLIVDGRTGLLAPAGSVMGIAQRLLILLEDATIARRLGDAAHKWVRDHADLAGLPERWAGVYEQVRGLNPGVLKSI